MIIQGRATQRVAPTGRDGGGEDLFVGADYAGDVWGWGQYRQNM